MDTRREGKRRRRSAGWRSFGVEALEHRQLLTTVSETFTGPSLAGLIAQAEKGKNTAPSEINRMLNALESQLQAGPLADLNSGAVDGNGFIEEAQGLEASFEANVDSQLSARSPNVDQVLKLQGQSVVSNLIALNQRISVGLGAGSTLDGAAGSTIAALTAGPVTPLSTTPSGMAAVTKSFRSELDILEDGLANSTVTLAQADATLDAEAEAYRSYVHAGLQVTQLGISDLADDDINSLESGVNTIAEDNSSDAQAQLSKAVNAFVAKTLDTTGLFGTHGAFSKARKTTFQPDKSGGQLPSAFEDVSGTATEDGTATLTATLTYLNGSPMMATSVIFTLDGAYAGIAETNFQGVATLTGVPTTDVVGTDTGAVTAYFPTTVNFLSAVGSGGLVVSQAATTLGALSGTATFGGPATLMATLTSSTTGQALAGETVNFTLDGNAVGSAVTDAKGLATLTGATTTDAAGTTTGAINASFAGDANNAASDGTGDLVVSQAGASLSAVAGTATFGGTATLTANLTSAVTGSGIAGQTVDFTLDGTSVGTAVTDSTGLATLTGVTNTDSVGTDTGGIVASFAGSTDFTAAANATGNLVVSQTETSLTDVDATASFGGTATLTAILTSSTSGAGIAGQTVSFDLSGTAVGTAVTDSSGVATLSGIATAEGVGTVSDAVIAVFAGNGNFSSSNTTGNLIVNQAGSSLSGVSGTATFGGTATLTANLTSAVTGSGIAGQTVDFTLDGVSDGTAVTDSTGLATLTGVTNTDSVGTDSGGVVASFAGSTNFTAAANATGNLVVSKVGTTLIGVAGSASFGGMATLTATLQSSATGSGISGQTVSFSLDGTVVGTGITDNNGLATLTGVSTGDAVGTTTGDVVATYAGGTNDGSSTATGNLVVSQSATTVSAVSGTAEFGGTATLTATLDSSATNLGLSGKTISFSLDGKVVGTAVTNSNGVATLSNVATTDAVGTDTGQVVATFAGDTDDTTSNGLGDLVVSQSGTSLSAVSGSAEFGGTATLTAILDSSATGSGLAGQTVTFTLDKVSVGTATTNANGVATLPGVVTADDAGTDTGGVAVSFAGDTDAAASNGSGNLVISPAPTLTLNVSGTAPVGGPAMLTATLVSTVTTEGIDGKTIAFTLDKEFVGYATTNSSGVATLPNVATTDVAGPDTGGVLATFAGDTDDESSQGTGDLTVS